MQKDINNHLRGNKKVYANKLNILWELFLSYLTVSQYIDEDYL